jgi:hypothetical protein
MPTSNSKENEMAEIPQDEWDVKTLYIWFEKKEQLAKLQAEERLLRDRVVRHYFPSPKEGTNKVDLGGGYELKMTHGFDRKIDKALLNTLKTLKVKDYAGQLQAMGFDPTKYDQEITVFQALGISEDKLVRYKPELETKEYRTLTAEQTAIFNQCMEIKPSSPQVKIEPNAAKQKELAHAAEVAAAPKPSTDISDLSIPSLTGK